MRSFRALIAAIGLVAALLPIAASAQYGEYPPPSPAGSTAESQLRTAILHARELAAGSAAISGIQQHLQHVINCLQGTRGKDFKAAAGNPCEGPGNNGFLNDARDKPGAVFLARHASDIAVDTVSNVRDVATAQAAARGVAGVLEEALKLLR